MKYFLLKVKDVGLSILPILLVVLVLHFFCADFDSVLLGKFIISFFVIILGEVLFLSGVDGSIMQMGEMVGNSVNRFSKFAVVLLFAFIFGLFATVAEPDLNVLSNQVSSLGLINVSKFLFIFTVGAGVGAFVALALFRIVQGINYKLLILAVFVVVFILCALVPNSIVAIAFDAGGATTGIITSPFLLALSAGIAKNKNRISHSDNFGVIGIASLGPILAILFLSIITMGKSGSDVLSVSLNLNIFIDVLLNALFALIPLIIVFSIFSICFLKISRKKKISLSIGVLITFVGLYLFLFGIDFGMIEMGKAVGEFISKQSNTFVIIVSVVIGFLITFAEPAVRVLGAQVEEVTQGNIRRRFVIVAIAIAMMLAVCISSLKILYDIPTIYILLVGYLLVLILMPFSNSTFVSIAFDSGGVASGPMSVAFILPIMLGIASSMGVVADGFGLIAIVGMMPIITIEFIGVFYGAKLTVLSRKEHKKALRISYGLNMYSNIDSLEEAYNRRQALKKMQQESAEEFQEKILIAKQYQEVMQIKEASDEEIEG